MQLNPTKKQRRKGKRELENLLKKLNDYSISVNDLLELSQPAWKGNQIDFANIYKHAVNLKINSFDIKETNLLNDAIFECKVSFNYSFLVPSEKQGYLKECSNIDYERNIRIVPELANGNIDINGTYKPSILFIVYCANHAHYISDKRNKEVLENA
jgi:hypothetical protein